jgi:hypothetical protein
MRHNFSECGTMPLFTPEQPSVAFDGTGERPPLIVRSRAVSGAQKSALSAEAGGFFGRIVIDIGFAINREQHGAAGRPVVVHRTRLAPNEISGRRQSVMILDAALQNKRLLILENSPRTDLGFSICISSHLRFVEYQWHFFQRRIEVLPWCCGTPR